MLSRRGMAPASIARLPSILWDERQGVLVLDQCIIRVSPAEYAIIQAVYHQGERWLRGEAPRLMSREVLAEQACVPSEHLYRTVCRASHKLEPHEWVIAPVHAWGYGLFSVAELGSGSARLHSLR